MPSLPYWLFPGDDRPTPEIDAEIAEELQLHLDLLAEERQRRGLPPAEAKRDAAERFGNFDRYLRLCRVEKQGDVPMLKRIQAIITTVLLLSVIALGWQQWSMSRSIAQGQLEIRQDVSRLIAALEGRPVESPAAAPAAAWTPDSDADPSEILKEAREDASKGRYGTALAKHLWYFENAVRLQPSLGAVRRSFALSAWHELGVDYPPALAELRRIRDSLEERVNEGEYLGDGFHDLASINQTLGQDHRTVASFRSLDAKNERAAARALHFVKRTLIERKEFELLGKYVDGERDYQTARSAYDVLAESESRAELAEQLFRHRTAEVVAMLVMCKRQDEAEQVVALARERLDDAAFHQELEAALRGELPRSRIGSSPESATRRDG